MKIEINNDPTISSSFTTITVTTKRAITDEMMEILQEISKTGCYEQQGSDINNMKYDFAIQVLLQLNIVEAKPDTWHYILYPNKKSCITKEHIKILLATNKVDNNLYGE